MAGGVSGHARETDVRVAEAWELVARHLPSDASAHLKPLGNSADREAALARATVMLDVQPTTEDRLRETLAQLLELARGDDEVALAAGYLAGRVCQVHFFAPDYARAAEIYEGLAQKNPKSRWAQLALVKLAVLKLYALPEPAEPASRVAIAESYLPRVTEPDLRRDLQLAIGRARLFHGLDGFLPHLVAAAEGGEVRGLPLADLQIQIGELSRRAGAFDQAETFFRKFLAENEVDGRVYAVRQRLAQIAEARGAKPEAKP
jgi:tetratricopeptide (TPR) repeat protein